MVDVETPTYCPVCGAEAPESGRYCSECGSDLLGETNRAPNEPAADDDSAIGEESNSITTLTRRRVLFGGGAIALGGGAILGLDALNKPTHRVYGEGWDVERDSGLATSILEGTVTIPAGRYAARILQPSTAAEYNVDFEVTGGGAIDVFLFDDDEYDRYRDQNTDFQLLARVRNETSGQLSTTVGAGDYRIVFDNTGFVGADPSGEVTVAIELTASRA